jgi:hypothetical protein
VCAEVHDALGRVSGVAGMGKDTSERTRMGYR